MEGELFSENLQNRGWLGFTACQPIGSFYAKYVFIYELALLSI